MGKSVPKGIKSKANIILKEMPADFNESFENNKLKVKELKLPFSKWTTNVMSGFMTRHHKKIRKAEEKKEQARKKSELVMKEHPDMKKTISPTMHMRIEKQAEEAVKE